MFVLAEISFAPKQGIESVSKNSNKSRWNASTFSRFVEWAGTQGLGAVDVWRNDIDVTWPVDATAPWMLATLDKFRTGG
eukprot:COSAG04_NODE_168_length_21684_cov_19.787121_17_plen_79_part_00